MQVQIPSALLKAVMLFRAKNDIRYYLNGMLLETTSKGGRIVCCDGHTLAAGRFTGSFATASIIVPNALLDAFKYTNKFAEPTICFDPKEKEVRTVEMKYGAMKTSATEIEGKFPDYRRVIPKSVSGDASQYNPEYLMRLEKAAQMFNKNASYPGIGMNGAAGGLCVIEQGNLAMVVMPMRAEPIDSGHDWVFDAAAEKAKETAEA